MDANGSTNGEQMAAEKTEPAVESALPPARVSASGSGGGSRRYNPNQRARSILKPSRPNDNPQHSEGATKTISWVDLHGQELAEVHEFEPR